MGTIIPPPISPPPVVAGDRCPTCWGVGKTFGDTDTPKYIQFQVSGINKGPNWIEGHGEPPEGTFMLIQDQSDACYYRDVFDGTTYEWFWRGVETFARIEQPCEVYSFFADLSEKCSLRIENQLVSRFIGGSILVTLPAVLP